MIEVLLILVLIMLILNTKIEILLFVIGCCFSLLVASVWAYVYFDTRKDRPKYEMQPWTRIVSFVLKTVTAAVIYLYLCSTGLIPDAFIYVPAFLKTLAG